MSDVYLIPIDVTDELLGRLKHNAITTAKFKAKVMVDPSVMIALVEEIKKLRGNGKDGLDRLD